MTLIRVPLNRIDDNPYQTRAVYGDLAALADNIRQLAPVLAATSGLIQVPLARLVKEGEVIIPPDDAAGVYAYLDANPATRVELALGHRRKRAFAQLALTNRTFATFPVDVALLEDQAMADIAWSENAKRIDLSDVERALAIEIAQRDFGWTQAQIGERWGLSQGAVANLLRLLRLPDKIQALIREGELTGRHGRALLPLVDLGARWEVFLDAVRPGQQGRPSVAEVERFVQEHLERETYPLADAPWAEDWVPENVTGTRACQDCPQRVTVGREARCTSVTCFHAKQRAYKHQVKAPGLANRVYNERLRNGWEQADVVSGWARCAACGRGAQELPAGDWLRSGMTYLCPECAERAQLRPHVAEAGTSQVIASVTVTGRDDGGATNPPVAGETVRSTWEPPRAVLAQSSGSVPGTQPLAPKPTLPPPAPQPQITPPPPVATILTARILPGDVLPERPVLLSIGDEGHGAAAFRRGRFADFGTLIDSLTEEYFVLDMEVAHG